MQVDANWVELRNQLSTWKASPPFAVGTAMAALIGNDGIMGSWSAYQSERPTRWSAAVVTVARMLAYVELEFDAEAYDLAEDISPRRKSDPVTVTVRDAWAKPLRTVTGWQIGRADAETSFQGVRRDLLPVSQIRVRFSDGDDLALSCDQENLYSQPPAECCSSFLAALRDGASW